MATLYIDRKGADIDAEADTLVVRTDGERRGTVPLRPLERVVVQGTARLTTRLIARLMERGIGLVVLAGRYGRPAASFVGRPSGDVGLRLAQYALSSDEPARAALSAALVAAKIKSQHRVLSDARDHGRTTKKPLRDALDALETALARLEHEDLSRPAIRGVEGAAAAAYFRALGTQFAPSLDFNGRNRRPPRDPVNVCLSLGYTLLHAEAVRAAAIAGLDPMIGVYHDPRSGRESLASDLTEPLRPFVDRFVIDLFREQTLRPEDFSRARDRCLMKKRARRDFYAAFEQGAPVCRRLLGRIVRSFVTELRTRESASEPRLISTPPLPAPQQE